jgi:AcrR family transcriptional regulator
VDARRERILDAAQALFVEQGLEQTSMRQIAAESGITAVTLYRYFPDRHPIAIEIAARMVERIVGQASGIAHAAAAAPPPAVGVAEPGSAEEVVAKHRRVFGHYCLAMVDEFRTLRDAYRFIGNFDHVYAGSYPSRELAALYRRRLREAVVAMPTLDLERAPEAYEFDRERMVTLTNVIMSFMEKMAARGVLMGREQRVSLKRQLTHFRSYVESVLAREFGWCPGPRIYDGEEPCLEEKRAD